MCVCVCVCVCVCARIHPTGCKSGTLSLQTLLCSRKYSNGDQGIAYLAYSTNHSSPRNAS